MASSTDAGPLRRLRPAVIVAGLLILAIATVAEASILRGLTPAQLRQSADAIVTGRVVGTSTVLTDGRLETEVRVRVLDAWRGPGLRKLTVRVPGGLAADGRRVIVPGAPEFERGERVLLFLYADERVWRPVGLFQGVWRLDPEDPAIVRASPSGGAVLVPPDDGGAPAVSRIRRPIDTLVGGGGR